MHDNLELQTFSRTDAIMGLHIKRLRKAAGYDSVKSLAEAAQIPARKIAAWESGSRRISLKDASDLADFLDCSLDELAGRDFAADACTTDGQRGWVISCYERLAPIHKRFVMQSARYAELASRVALADDTAKNGKPSSAAHA